MVKKNRQGNSWEEYLHLRVRKRKKRKGTSQGSWEQTKEPNSGSPKQKRRVSIGHGLREWEGENQAQKTMTQRGQQL